MARDMTEGKPLSLILRFSIPILLGNLFQQLYNVVDTAIVGRYLGTSSLAAVGATSSVQFLCLGFCMGICTGFGIPVAQRFGAKDYEGMQLILYNAALLTVGIAAIMTTLCTVFCNQILHLLSVPQDIYDETYIYIFVIFAGIPFSMLYNILSTFMRAVGDSRTPFVVLCISTVLNILLDLLFVIVLKLGVVGAAAATVTAQAVSGLLCLFSISRHVPVLHIAQAYRQFRKEQAKQLLVMGIPMGLQFSITAIGSMTMQSANNALGTVYVSAFTAGTRIKALAMCPFDAVATATSTFCGQNYGAGNYRRIKKGLRLGIIIGVGYGTFAALMLIFFGRTLSTVFVDASAQNAEEVLLYAARYLACLGYFYWILGILNITRMVVQALGYSGRAVFAGFLEMGARVLVSTIAVPRFGYWGICFSDQAAWICAAAYICIIAFTVLKKIRRELPDCELTV